GTLFLDEVGEIPLPQQAKLLRFLENREYRPLGSTDSRKFTGRVVAATNRSLREEVKSGRLREDLMFRLDVLSVRLPPLRERLGDLSSLAESLLGQLALKYGRRKPLLQQADLQALQQHHFPGNVRELRNLLERSLLKTSPESAWLNIDLGWLTPAGPEDLPALREFASPVAPSIPSVSPTGIDSKFVPPADRQLSPLEAPEYQLIAQALREERGGIRRAAARLGLTHQALLRRLQKWPELRKAAAE
ncbi:MAG TPA: sigma-54-dependent Fis family transcriptional regulator, partial [Verrucomicrobiales bacterium]|nr:sigma-54-dependent Fis family transcriptional regulator [Verrucomicrobiales bacterium]